MMAATPACPAGTLLWQDVLLFALCWEVLYQVAKALCKLSSHEKVKKLGASYCVAFCNALACSVGGTWATLSLLAGDYSGRAAVTTDLSPYWPGGQPGVLVYERYAHMFLGWLAYDIVHIATHYPKLGGIDTVAHHLGFICLTCLGSTYRVLPF